MIQGQLLLLIIQKWILPILNNINQINKKIRESSTLINVNNMIREKV